MLATSIRLHDVKDAEAFVAANVQRSGVIVRDTHEREDLIAEGLVILCELADRYEPHRAGYEKAGSFAGYAAKFLPGRMRDAYYALHPEHVARRDQDGRRVYEFGERPMSLQHDDMPQLPATAAVIAMPSIVGTCWDPGPTVAEAIRRVPGKYGGFMTRRVVEHIDEGYSPDEIARRLRLDRGDVAAITGAVGSSLWELQTGEAA
ncbi:MAG: hypothetical protein ACLGIK_14025 [Gemmatimonadota bacterium]